MKKLFRTRIHTRLNQTCELLQPPAVEKILGRRIGVIFECGAGPYLEAGLMVHRADTVILVDPISRLLDMWEHAWERRRIGADLVLHQRAIAYYRGQTTMMVEKRLLNDDLPIGRTSLSFLTELGRPRGANPQKKVAPLEVECCLMSDIDPGNIDVAVIDTKGGEWFVLQTMVSRPALIMIECGENHRFRDKILGWMDKNGYSLYEGAEDLGNNLIFTHGK